MTNLLAFYKKAELPHLRATVYFCDLSKLKGVEHKGSAYTTVFGENEDLWLEIAVFIKDIAENTKNINATPQFAHEITHVLEYLCENRNMSIDNESEHLAFIMSYLMETLLDCLPDEPK